MKTVETQKRRITRRGALAAGLAGTALILTTACTSDQPAGQSQGGGPSVAPAPAQCPLDPEGKYLTNTLRDRKCAQYLKIERNMPQLDIRWTGEARIRYGIGSGRDPKELKSVEDKSDLHRLRELAKSIDRDPGAIETFGVSFRSADSDRAGRSCFVINADIVAQANWPGEDVDTKTCKAIWNVFAKAGVLDPIHEVA